MAKYELLKDLPGAKAGTISKDVNDDENIEFPIKGFSSGIMIHVSKIDFLIKDGWVKLVEEKEFTRSEVKTLMDQWAKLIHLGLQEDHLSNESRRYRKYFLSGKTDEFIKHIINK